MKTGGLVTSSPHMEHAQARASPPFKGNAPRVRVSGRVPDDPRLRCSLWTASPNALAPATDGPQVPWRTCRTGATPALT